MVGLLQDLSSCGTAQIPVNIPNVTFYTDEGTNGAFITRFFSSDVSSIGKPAWDSIREGMSCISASDVGSIKAALEQLCSEAPCNEATIVAARSLLARLAQANSQNR